MGKESNCIANVSNNLIEEDKEEKTVKLSNFGNEWGLFKTKGTELSISTVL